MNFSQHFQVVTENAQKVAGPFITLRQAVLHAVQYDGYGGCFERMSFEGHIHPTFPMRLFTSRIQIGNHPYFPSPQESLAPYSLKLDDELAKDEVALEVYLAGILHYCHSLKIEIVNGPVNVSQQSAADSAPPEQA